jgi:hypothetical protein
MKTLIKTHTYLGIGLGFVLAYSSKSIILEVYLPFIGFHIEVYW